MIMGYLRIIGGGELVHVDVDESVVRQHKPAHQIRGMSRADHLVWPPLQQ